MPTTPSAASTGEPVDGTATPTSGPTEPVEEESTGTSGVIGGRVFEDLDVDGVRDPGERGVESVTVHAWVPGGSLAATAQTDGDGVYELALPPGDYELIVVQSIDWLVTPVAGGAADGVVEDLTAGSRRTVDVGYVATAEIGGVVFEDLDRDGIRDEGEPGIEAVQVAVDAVAGGTARSGGAQTLDGGRYVALGLLPGTYVAEFAIPDGWALSPPNRGDDPALDSDADPSTGRTGLVSVGFGEFDDTINAGLFRTAPSATTNDTAPATGASTPVDATPATTSVPTTIAATGVSAVPLVLSGLALATVGAAFVGAADRRHRRPKSRPAVRGRGPSGDQHR